MKANSVRHLRQLVASKSFETWYARFLEAREAVEQAHARHDDPLMHLVLLAGAYQDRSAQAHAEFARIENDSFEVLSQYETERQRASQSWAERDRADKLLEDFRAEAAETRAKLDAARRTQRSDATIADVERLAAEMEILEERVQNQMREVELLRQKQQEDRLRKEQLWREVETAWLSAFRANMARAEYAYKSRKVRRQAERFATVGQDSEGSHEVGGDSQVDENLEKLEAELAGVRERGQQSFECALIGDFMYWPHGDDAKLAVCVPLIDEPDHLNIQVKALEFYQIERAKGVEYIEPLPPDHLESDDPRLDAFFTKGRPRAAVR